jgi:hypothetical protein
MQLLSSKDAGGAEQVLVGRLLTRGHKVAKALLTAARSAHIQGQGDIGAPPGRTREEEVSLWQEEVLAGDLDLQRGRRRIRAGDQGGFWGKE